MGIVRKQRRKPGLTITVAKLRVLITEFLTQHEADMAADYKPESEEWRQLLADALATYIVTQTKK
ncbi:MAG: hypothetical protein DRN26_00095 [Thermoplasmata archaeon]|nr:MAG: hypothetical protein DRN26_00095 [Thermoplasmata archaeon]